MSNVDVFLKKLKLPAKYLKEPVVEIMLRKPGTLSKNEKKLLINLVNLFELRDIKPKISRNILKNIMAAGKPILYIGERGTEIWRMIEENGNGFCFEPWDKDGLISFLRELSIDSRISLSEMGQISRRLAEQKYSKKTILRRFLEVI